MSTRVPFIVGAAGATILVSLAACLCARPALAQDKTKGDDNGVKKSERVRMVRVIVEDHSGLTKLGQPMPTLYMATSLTDWNPAGIRNFDVIQYQPTGSTDWVRAWGFNIGYDFATNPALEFKFTRGDWGTVEVAADGADIPNRTFDLAKLEKHGPYQTVLMLEGFADQRGTRWPAPAGSHDATVTGQLDVFTLATDHLDRHPTIRVWLPPGYNDPANADVRYPVMYLHDGQNLFDTATSFIGVEWGVDETATELIEAKKIPPLIVVGIDNGGPARAAEYNPPYTEFDGRANYADRYVAFLADDLMPTINERYRTRPGPENTGLGGSSYGGAVTLYALMERPDLFSRALVESPAVFASDGALVKHLREFKGSLPDRVFIGVGTKEVEDADRSAGYVSGAHDIAQILIDDGIPTDHVRLVVEPDAIHNESAWARRLPEALEFLWGNAK